MRATPSNTNGEPFKMSKYNSFFARLSDVFPYERKSSASWLVPASIGICAGIAAGVGIGMLYAPRPGSETRQRIRERAEQAKESARVAAGRVRGQLESAADEIRERSFMSADMGHSR
jgi:hypothetical protein